MALRTPAKAASGFTLVRFTPIRVPTELVGHTEEVGPRFALFGKGD